jgi:hypothetical protein
MDEIQDKLEWTISVPILRNSIIIKQLGIAIGIPFGILIIFLIFTKAWYGLILITALLLFTYLIIMIVWGGNYHVGFELNKNGIRNYTMEVQAKKNLVINAATIILGLFSGKLTVAGAGFLAQSRQDVFIKWKNIKKTKYLPAKYTVMVRGSLTENIAIFCNRDNYPDVEAYIRACLEGINRNTPVK